MLLEVSDLRIGFSLAGRQGLALAGVDFQLAAAERLGLVGESGSGKSVLAMALCALLDCPPARIHGGSIRWQGEDLPKKSQGQVADLRGREFSLLMQDPSTALNPLWSIGQQLTETMQGSGRERREAAIRALSEVGILRAEEVCAQYPHQLSGGMRQRAALAAVLAVSPRLLVADEPTTALDATVQKRVLALLDGQVRERQMALLLISHDLAVVARRTDRVIVLYAGLVMEEGPTRTLLRQPLHPYTQALANAIPRVDDGKLPSPIPGIPPTLFDRPPACPFHPRCVHAEDICRQKLPPLRPCGEGRKLRCHLSPDKTL